MTESARGRGNNKIPGYIGSRDDDDDSSKKVRIFQENLLGNGLFI